MKKLYIFLLSASFFCSFGTFAQSFSPETTSLTTAAPVGEYVTGSINILNSSLDSIQLEWELVEKIAPADWDYSYCD